MQQTGFFTSLAQSYTNSWQRRQILCGFVVELGSNCDAEQSGELLHDKGHVMIEPRP